MIADPVVRLLVHRFVNNCTRTVSYTHLDVYKRQLQRLMNPVFSAEKVHQRNIRKVTVPWFAYVKNAVVPA